VQAGCVPPASSADVDEEPGLERSFFLFQIFLRLLITTWSQAGSMPDGITKLARLETLDLNTPFAPKRRLPDGFGALPLSRLTLWGGNLGDDTALDELAGLKDLEVRKSEWMACVE